MVARARIEGRRPVVDVHMVDRNTAAECNRRRDKHMVKLLRVLVEKVRVALYIGHARGRVDLGQELRKWREDGARLRVLIVIACDNDVRVWVFLEEALDETLRGGCQRL